MKKAKAVTVMLLGITVFSLLLAPRACASETFYTYTYDYWGEERESPDAYRADVFITGSGLGIGDFKDPQGLFVRGNLVYVCDTGNNRIVVLEKRGETLAVAKEIREISGDTQVKGLSGPQDIYVAENGDYYICDTGNQRVIHTDPDGRLIQEMVRPVDETVDQRSDFLPLKAVADGSGRVFVLVKNYNKGFLEFEKDGEFSGYIGANAVKFDLADYMWKSMATKEQKEQMEQFVPTEYNNLALDADDFIYATTSVFEEYELKSDQAKPIRKLNSMGSDILVKNGNFPPVGDLDWGVAEGVSGASRLVDVTAMENDTYYVVDRTRGRIFGYDSQGNLLYGFGGLGNQLGYLRYPVALEHMGTDLLALDSQTGGITRYRLTQYGALINAGLEEYQKGNYDKSADYWREVLAQNGNYDLAYIGIGRSLLRQEHYKEAMEYFKLKRDSRNYSKAYKLYRKVWFEENIGWIFGVIAVLVVLSLGTGLVRKIKEEVQEL